MTASVLDSPPSGRAIAAPVLQHRVDAEEARESAALAAECLRRYGDPTDPTFQDGAPFIAGDLPRRVRALLHAARRHERLNAVVVRGHDVAGQLEPTPGHWRDADLPAARRHGFLLVLHAALLGDVVGWATQQDGRLVTDVVPTRGQETSLVSSSSELTLGWHTEDAFSPARADYVGLHCLRSPEPIATTVAAVDPGALPSRVAEVLAQERFVIRPDDSHSASQNSDPDDAFARLESRYEEPPRVALLGGSPEAPVLRIDRDFTEVAGVDPEAGRALTWLIGHLDDRLEDLVLAPGDIAFLDNRNVVHGRRAFRPRYDGTDRWLKRVNVVTDLRRVRPHAPESPRVLG